MVGARELNWFVGSLARSPGGISRPEEAPKFVYVYVVLSLLPAANRLGFILLATVPLAQSLDRLKTTNKLAIRLI